MRKLFNLKSKYGFSAPLIGINLEFDVKEIINQALELNITNSELNIITKAIEYCYEYEEKIISLDYLAEKIGKSVSLIRRNITSLKEKGICEVEFVTTDQERNRRGSLFTFVLPNEKMLDLKSEISEQHYEFTYQNSDAIHKIESPLYHKDSQRFSTGLALNIFAKALRTNRRDKRKTVEVKIEQDNAVYKIVTEGISNKIASVQDLIYYTSCITWLINAIELLYNNNEQIPETYDLPLLDIVRISQRYQNSNIHTYISPCVEAIERLSGTRFDLQTVPKEIAGKLELNLDQKVWYNFFRLDALFNVSNGEQRPSKYARIQFPKSIIDTLIETIKNENSQFLIELTKAQAFKSKNEIEILFYLWIRQQKNHATLRGSYTWERLRQVIAPQTELSEFKTKFSKMMVEYADDDFIAKLSEDDDINNYSPIKSLLTKTTREGMVVHYGRTTIYGLTINIGKIDVNQTSIFLRVDQNTFQLEDRFSAK
jgi:hypothetical protein